MDVRQSSQPMAAQPSYERLDPPIRTPAPARPRPVAGLFDLLLVPAPGGGLALPSRPAVALDADQIAQGINRMAGDACDVRIVVNGGERYAGLLRKVAQVLNRDVLVTPNGTELLRMIPAGGDVVPVNLSTGHAQDWIMIQPPADGPLPGWFELSSGLVRPRSGPIRLPLRGGLAIARRPDFVAARQAADRLGSGHPGLFTVALSVHWGNFVDGYYDGSAAIHDGESFATVLADLPLRGADLRVWLDWPIDAGAVERLRHNLKLLAAATGAVVWAPPPGNRAEIIDSCRDLGARTPDGSPERWEAYQPQAGAPLRYESDLDGRLVPAAGFSVGRFPGVPLVSVPRARRAEAAEHHSALPGWTGRFPIDLPVLADGRLALVYADDRPVAVGPAAMRQLLARAGWNGEDITLVRQVPPNRSAAFRRYAARMGAELGCAITTAAGDNAPPGTGPAPWNIRRATGPQVIREIRRQLPDLARRHHRLAAVRDDLPLLVDSWFRLHRHVTLARFDPPEHGPMRTDEVVDAYQELTLMLARKQQPQVADNEVAVRVCRDLARLGAAHVYQMVPIALANLAAADPDQVWQLPVLAEAIANYLVLDREFTLDRQGSPPDGPGSTGPAPEPARTSIAKLEGLRFRIEMLVAGVVGEDTSGMLTAAPNVAKAPPSDTSVRAVPVTAGPSRDARVKNSPVRAVPLSDAHPVVASRAEAPPVPVPPADILLNLPPAGMPPVNLLPAPTAALALRAPSDVVKTLRRPAGVAARGHRPHGLTWLPRQVEANAEPFNLWVLSKWDLETAAERGVPSPHLFLLARLSPERSAGDPPGGHLLQIHVEPAGAVDVTATGSQPPPDVQHLFNETYTYLIPAGWLDRSHLITEGSARQPLRICCVAGHHGTSGLPDEVERWPEPRIRAAVRRYALIPQAGPDQPEWLELHPRRPKPVDGHRLVELRVGRRRAIDLSATASRLEAFPAVRSRVADLRAGGVRYILPRGSYRRVSVTRIFERNGKRWRPRSGHLDVPLSAVIHTLRVPRPKPGK